MGIQSSMESTVFVIGNNEYGQLGLHHDKEVKELVAWNEHNKNITIEKINNGGGYTIIVDG